MNLINKSKMFFKRNSSTILTCIGAIGVIATTVTAVKATPKAMSLLQKAETDKGDDLTTMEKIKIAGPAYIPAAAIGASTIGCIFGANVLNKRHQASLVSAYALLDNSYKEYRNKVKDIYGVEGHDVIIKDLCDDKINKDDAVLADNEKQFFDFFSLQSFVATFDDIRRAEEFVNNALRTRGYVALSEFYEELGITFTDMDCALGWSVDQGYDHVEIIIEQNKDHYIILMSDEPTPNYFYN